MAGMKIEGEPVKRYRVFRLDINDEPFECDGEYETLAELRTHRRRLDRRYKICVGRKFMTDHEFEDWKKQNIWECEICGQEILLNPRGPQLPANFSENCKLREHMIGNECIAFRDLPRAKELAGRS